MISSVKIRHSVGCPYDRKEELPLISLPSWPPKSVLIVSSRATDYVVDASEVEIYMPAFTRLKRRRDDRILANSSRLFPGSSRSRQQHSQRQTFFECHNDEMLQRRSIPNGDALGGYW